MKKILFVLAALTFVSACSTQSYDPWIGRSEEEVVDRMGLPTRAYTTLNKTRYMIYKSGGCSSAVNTPSYVVTRSGCVFPAGSSGSNQPSTTVFIINDGKVETWSGARPYQD